MSPEHLTLPLRFVSGGSFFLRAALQPDPRIAAEPQIEPLDVESTHGLTNNANAVPEPHVVPPGARYPAFIQAPSAAKGDQTVHMRDPRGTVRSNCRAAPQNECSTRRNATRRPLL